jgi:hypothetical protein
VQGQREQSPTQNEKNEILSQSKPTFQCSLLDEMVGTVKENSSMLKFEDFGFEEE